MNDLSTGNENGYLTASDLQRQSNMIVEILKTVLKEGIHYGKPFVDSKKFTLLKPGTEKILTTFRIAVDPETDDLSTGDEIRYRVRCKGQSILTGNLIGVGIGECSSNEEKYKWKKPVCKEEFEETPADRRREKWQKNYNGTFEKIQQIRTNPADIANTILKMAKKRAQADLTLTATAASDIFDAPEYDDQTDDQNWSNEPTAPKTDQKKPPEPPKRKSEATPSGNLEIVLSGECFDVTKSTGKTKDNKDYTVYHISAPEGKYTTFSESFAQLAHELREKKADVKIVYKIGKYGNDIVTVEAA